MEKSTENDRIRLYPEGDMTVSRAADLRNSLLESLRQSGSVEIDLGKVGTIDLSFLQLLCSAHRTAVLEGKSFAVINRDVPFLQMARLKSGFAFHKSCRFNAAGNCLWAGEMQE